MNKNDIYILLNKNKIPYEINEHKPVYKVEDLEALNLPHSDCDGKNLFLKDDKKNYYLITIKGNKKINLKDFKNKYHTHSLSFTSPTELKELMNLIPGEVGPFGLLNDKEAKIKFYIDEAFMTDSHLIGVHPNDNTVSLWLKVEDLIKIIENNGNNIYFFNLWFT